ncbi:MAG: multifunctional aminopeptidase A [Alphaproteobacteria bacterium ADurb.Bin438]|nr:MAG: multifunctional aminopeptidase A [Alphaproteobacteria bacterium ADurb.Bin438]
MVNSSSSGMAGAITAALFLESFVDKNIPWVHIDTFAYNESKKAGKPEGGEALALKAVFDFISNNHK